MCCRAWLQCSLQKGVKLIAIADTVLFFLTIAASVSFEHFVCHRRPIKISIYLTGTEFQEGGIVNGSAIWDYLTNSYEKISACVPALSYVVFTSFIVLLVGYLVIEIWMCCLLIKGANKKSLPTCRKWMNWRLGLLVLAFTITASDVAQMQYTCTDLAILPLNAFRAVSILVVYVFMKEMCVEDKYLIRLRV